MKSPMKFMATPKLRIYSQGIKMEKSEQKKILDLLKRLQYRPYKDMCDRPTGTLSYITKKGHTATTLCNADGIIPAFKRDLRKLLKELTDEPDTDREWITNGNAPDEPLDEQQNWGIFG